MKLFTSDQLKMINRTYPITFTEDEFSDFEKNLISNILDYENKL